MLDFNAKKEILRRLQKKGAKNVFMRVLCAIAALFVKLWYGIACRIGMGLSDKNGNFLGIKGLGEKTKSRRQDDIIYVKKPFLGRVLSAVLAVSFVFMVAPELGLLDLSVFAIDVDGQVGYQVYEPGKSEPTTFFLEKKVDGVNYLYRADDSKAAKAKAISGDIKYKTGYGTVYFEWNWNNSDTESIKLEGFHVDFYSAGGNKSEDVDSHTFSREYTNLSTGSAYAVVTPRMRVQLFTYDGVLDENQPSTGGHFNPLDIDSRNPDNYKLIEAKPADDRSRPVTLDARYNPPAVSILVNGEPKKSADLDTNRVNLTWTAAPQVGGNESVNATAYNVYYVKDDGTVGYVVEGTTSTSALYTASYGEHYEFFVEAYRNVWNGTNTNGTNTSFVASNPGLISSSSKNGSRNEGLTPAAKASSIYSEAEGYTRAEVYIAPNEPDLTITANGKTNTIDVKASPVKGRGTYSGVYLFRTTGAEKFQLDSGVDLNGMNYGEWFVNNCTKKGNPYGVEFIDQFKGESSTYIDTDIVEGVTYWYYAVSYLEKSGTQTPLYSSSVASNSSKLKLNLETPLWIDAEPDDGKVTLKWEPVEGAQGYELEIIKTKCHKDDGCFYDKSEPPKPIVTVIPISGNKNTTYEHKRLYNDDEYQYRVIAYINVKSQKDDTEEPKFYSDWSSPMKVTVGDPNFLPPQNVSATTVDGAITVRWDRVAKAQTYTLHYKNLTTGEPEQEIAGLTGFTYTHTNLINEHRYTYWVVAYKNISGDGSHERPQVKWTKDSNYVTLKVGVELNIPQGVQVTTKDGETTVKWESVKGAEGYLLYYRGPTGDWVKNDLGSKTTFNHTRLHNGEVYEYYVVAYKTVSGERVYSEPSVTVSITVGDVLAVPKDFTVTTTDGVANLKWTASKGAEGYVVHAYSSATGAVTFDVSKPQLIHNNLINGQTWTYYVVAYKTVNGSRVYSDPTSPITVTIGISLTAAVDLTATAGNRQVVLTWTKVTGAEGYVVYLYNDITMEYEAIAVTSQTTYTHLGLKNGIGYTYMVAAYKTSNGTRVYGEYSMPVTAIPTTGSPTDIDRDLNIKGTAPYGISHGEYISAGANHGAFDESVDVYFTTNADSANAVKEVLRGYADGLSSFIIYPFDISVYKENTFIEIAPNRGYTITITMPIPDRLIAYRDYITVIHINEDADVEYVSNLEWLEYTDRRLEVLPCAVLDIDNVWCIQFECSSFSPYAIVIYKDHISDVSAGGGVMDGIFAGNFNSGVLLFTTLPDILPNNKKLRIVSGGRKRYSIKSIEKRHI